MVNEKFARVTNVEKCSFPTKMSDNPRVSVENLSAKYLPVRVISFAVFLARLSVSLREIAHTRAVLTTCYKKKNDKDSYIRYSTSKQLIPSRSEKYNIWGFSKELHQKKVDFLSLLNCKRGLPQLVAQGFTFSNLDADL